MLQYTLQSKIMHESKRMLIWENENFIVSTATIPHQCKFDGGHIAIRPKISVESIIKLSDQLMFEMMKIVQTCICK
jgi:hypothetical protein